MPSNRDSTLQARCILVHGDRAAQPGDPRVALRERPRAQQNSRRSGLAWRLAAEDP